MARLVRRKHGAEEPDYLPNVRRIGGIAADHKAIDLRAYDVHGLTVIADAFVMCSAASEPQFKALANAVRHEMKQVGVTPLNEEGRTDGNWLVLDYGSVIFHVFRVEARAFYDLDGLWADAPQIDLQLDE